MGSMDLIMKYMVRQKHISCIALPTDACSLSVSDAGMQAPHRRGLHTKGSSVGSMVGSTAGCVQADIDSIPVDRQRCRLEHLHTNQVCKSSHDQEHSQYVQSMVLYSCCRMIRGHHSLDRVCGT